MALICTVAEGRRVKKYPAATLILHMVLLLDGNSEIGAHVRTNFCYIIRSRV